MTDMVKLPSDNPELISVHYPDVDACQFACSADGQLLLLPGSTELAIVSLDNPADICYIASNLNGKSVSAVRWNPNLSSIGEFITTVDNVVTLWDVTSTVAPATMGSQLHHTNTIRDADWSCVSDNKIATCSDDCFTFIWDKRDIKKPELVLESPITSASKVLWNKHQENILATVHGCTIRVWDLKMSNRPYCYIESHKKRIVNIDWSHIKNNHLVSCSLDGVVKLWSIHNSEAKETDTLKSFKKGSPFSYAKYTPFGYAVLTSGRAPPGADTELLLWSLEREKGRERKRKHPINVRVGHDTGLTDLQWRCCNEGAEHQLLTWSENRMLQIWTVDPVLKQICGDGLDQSMLSPAHCAGPSTDESLNDSYVGGASQSKTNEVNGGLVTENLGPQLQPMSLAQEFALLNFDKTKVTLEEIDADRSFCTVSAVRNQHKVNVTFLFSEGYPNNVAPTFKINDGTTLDKPAQNRLVQALDQTAMQHVQHCRSCVESCLRRLVSFLENFAANKSSSVAASGHGEVLSPTKRTSPTFLSTHSAEILRNLQIPFPRTSGARFCGAGYLVCFTRRITEVCTNGVSENKKSPVPETTPRAMSALLDCTQNKIQAGLPMVYIGLARSVPSAEMSVTLSDFYKNRGQSQQQSVTGVVGGGVGSGEYWTLRGGGGASVRKSSPEDFVTGPVLIYDIHPLLPVSRHLAHSYLVDARNPIEMCNTNARIALAAGRRDLHQEGHPTLKDLPHSQHVYNLFMDLLGETRLPSCTGNNGDKTLIWLLAAVQCQAIQSCAGSSGNVQSDCCPWPLMPFGRRLVKSWLDHFSSQDDVQMLAMLCYLLIKLRALCCSTPALCSVTEDTASQVSTSKYQPTLPTISSNSQLNNMDVECSQSLTRQLSEMSYCSEIQTTMVTKVKRSNSWSESSFEEQHGTLVQSSDENNDSTAATLGRSMFNLLESGEAESRYDQYMESYANVLYRWGLFNDRAEILKSLSSPSTRHSSTIKLMVTCPVCYKEVSSSSDECCSSLTRTNLCMLCHTPVKGVCSYCQMCGHGGHVDHVKSWFSDHDQCPAGCGCHCVNKTFI